MAVVAFSRDASCNSVIVSRALGCSTHVLVYFKYLTVRNHEATALRMEDRSIRVASSCLRFALLKTHLQPMASSAVEDQLGVGCDA